MEAVAISFQRVNVLVDTFPGGLDLVELFLVVFILLGEGARLGVVKSLLQFHILGFLCIDALLELVKSTELFLVSAQLRDLGYILALISNFEGGRLDLLFELIDLIVNFVSRSEADAPTSIFLLLYELLDFSVIAIELVLLSPFGSFVLRLLGTDGLLIVDEDFESIVGRS